jgi:hypothetical protein
MNTLLNHVSRIGFIAASSALLAVFECSCATGANREYHMGYLNKTGRSLDEVGVYSNGKSWGFPALMVVGGEKTAGGITDPIPSEAEVRITEQGQQKTIKVSMKGVPSNFKDGTIYFVLNRDGTVVARAIRDDDEAGYAELAKGLRPAGEYRFGFVNRTAHELQAVTVFYDGQKVTTGGDIRAPSPSRARARFTYSDPLTLPRPATAELRWIENAAPHAVEVKLESVPKGFEGIIYFVIKADGTVEVHPIKNGDDKSAMEIVKW